MTKKEDEIVEDIVEELKEEEKKAEKKPKKEKKRKIREFSDLKPEEVKAIILDLNNKGKTKSEIGVILREQHGVPKASVILKKSIGEFLKEEKITQDIPEDLMSLIRKNVSLKSHLGTNKKDYTAKRGYELSLSKIRRLVKYYKMNKKLPDKWVYTDEIGTLLVK